MKRITRILAAAFAVCLMFTACGSGEKPAETTIAATETGADMEEITIYTGREVQSEEDLAIFKFNCEVPEGYDVRVDNAEGKVYASPNGSITVKAQNFKEEFQSLEVFADQGCAGILMSNGFRQAETVFSDPMPTKVAGFDAIRYDYTVTAYIYDFETDASGEVIMDEEGNPKIKAKNVYGEYVNRIYFFYSDEDVFYFICEAPKDKAAESEAVFDRFVESVTITPPKQS